MDRRDAQNANGRPPRSAALFPKARSHLDGPLARGAGHDAGPV
jgi:hypothetical protein